MHALSLAVCPDGFFWPGNTRFHRNYRSYRSKSEINAAWWTNHEVLMAPRRSFGSPRGYCSRAALGTSFPLALTPNFRDHFLRTGFEPCSELDWTNFKFIKFEGIIVSDIEREDWFINYYPRICYSWIWNGERSCRILCRANRLMFYIGGGGHIYSQSVRSRIRN